MSTASTARSLPAFWDSYGLFAVYGTCSGMSLAASIRDLAIAWEGRAFESGRC